ncbi:bifunctional polysaccharide deacetylase/glycosyltransferase family 2 protein [Streptomyces sp. NPDC046977]|uniref:bifunctional polysaccharide deacetylase/glycosyltransferase family 2 protein n=1 Tax=Streptomyces sp. NPDC046977 TaxID=3154703 RepID=UPI0033F537F6
MTGAPAATPRPRRRTAVPLRFVLPALLLATVLGMLVLRGVVHSEIGADHRVHPPVATARVPESVLDGGPIVDARGAVPRTLSVPRGTMVLTFDDGPDPRWTPEVLDKLAEYHAHAVFFVTGTMASRHPDLVRRIVAEGHEVGLHTFDHPDLVYQSKDRVDHELAANQLALAGAAGIHSSLFRPPYSSTANALDDLSWPVTRYVGERGYLTVFIDADTEDWARPGVDAIVRAAEPAEPGAGEIVLLHDAGGDRSQTVAALDRLLPEMAAQGYAFPTLTQALSAPSANIPVSGPRLWEGKAFVLAVTLSEHTMGVLTVLLAAVGVLVLARFGLMVLLSAVHARRARKRDARRTEEFTEPVTVVVPAYNEAACIANTVRSLVASDYPLEIVVVDDGSSDGTAGIVEDLALPGVRVIRQSNGGKPVALDNGVAHASGDIVVMMDGDTVFEPGTVRALVQPFTDPAVGAVAGNAKVGNRGTVLGAWQHIEYVMGFNLDRRMYDVLGCMPTIPGAVGAFRRAALRDVGGMSDDTLAEDTDVTIALHRAGWRVVYAEDARAWTEVPETVRQLWSQRYRWSYGTMQAIWKHRRAVREGGHSGRFGRLGLPLVSLFMVVAPLLAPLVDIFLLYGLVFGPTLRTAAAWCLMLVLQAGCAAYAFRLDRESPRHLVWLPLQQILYRQLMYLVLLQSWITALTGGRLRWQKLRRTGAVESPLAAV